MILNNISHISLKASAFEIHNKIVFAIVFPLHWLINTIIGNILIYKERVNYNIAISIIFSIMNFLFSFIFTISLTNYNKDVSNNILTGFITFITFGLGILIATLINGVQRDRFIEFFKNFFKNLFCKQQNHYFQYKLKKETFSLDKDDLYRSINDEEINSSIIKKLKISDENTNQQESKNKQNQQEFKNDQNQQNTKNLNYKSSNN